jgi:metal-responsive CopG/Arc/MetJ family transcriptional regulator
MPIDPEHFRVKRPVGRPKLPPEDIMAQISIRLPGWMLDEIDAINEHERFDQSDRATIIRELLAQAIDNRKR